MKKRQSVLLAAIVILTAAGPNPSSAQVLYGSIVGTTEDPTGAVVPGATVTLSSATTGATREVKADDQGVTRYLTCCPAYIA